jgi:hypothetical protein
MSKPSAQTFNFMQIHIEAARNSIDDFNLFHDKNKWQRIQGNPFDGPIVLGFQLECLLEYQILCYRRRHHEFSLMDNHGLRFSNYQVTFTNVVRPGEPVSLEIKKSQFKMHPDCILANRVLFKNAQGAVLIGYKKESQQPLYLPDFDVSNLPQLSAVPDRTYVAGHPFFLKRKFMNVGNAKNFLSGSLAEQSEYFDELENRIRFPEIFPVGLTSCALLERALKEGHDFERAPMVFTSHSFSVDRDSLRTLKSNDELHLLVGEPRTVSGMKGLGKSRMTQHTYACYGVNDGNLVFSAEISLAPLAEILDRSGQNLR